MTLIDLHSGDRRLSSSRDTTPGRERPVSGLNLHRRHNNLEKIKYKSDAAEVEQRLNSAPSALQRSRRAPKKLEPLAVPLQRIESGVPDFADLTPTPPRGARLEPLSPSTSSPSTSPRTARLRHSVQNDGRELMNSAPRRLPGLESRRKSIEELGLGQCKNVFEAALQARPDEIARLVAAVEEEAPEEAAVQGWGRVAKTREPVTGINLNDKDSDLTSSTFGKTPLMIAVEHGDEKTVKEILKHGANACVVDGNGRTTIHTASYLGHYGILVALLNTLPSVSRVAQVRRLDNSNFSPLLLAEIGAMCSTMERSRGISKGHMNVIDYLIENGAARKHLDDLKLSSTFLVGLGCAKFKSNLVDQKDSKRNRRWEEVGSLVRQAMKANGNWSKVQINEASFRTLQTPPTNQLLGSRKLSFSGSGPLSLSTTTSTSSRSSRSGSFNMAAPHSGYFAPAQLQQLQQLQSISPICRV
mmetsp:Transcript_41527/g.50337  ORF Transcript_41527/g.50337 Transcript_41527/m.50337 type:complete len:471 (+) Transcript_41527:132-1544(+)|eukprot:CAMPEP_0197859342 /NCGR_PEP_ID=MMETSP1438-20131217/33813_1 /TAXON_ID=1461541 /ORGANISM="Pterosperma sp., Strain CCMP1384" /LENGTH=470 /DNA_ID=CAMNT_0043475783 /DNA_START=121 /DNA_END=1533 /DNA_ORIENTATION=+